jgi:hypothetical protein
MKRHIVGGCLWGDKYFVKKTKEEYLTKDHKEIPSIRKIYYLSICLS